MRFTRLFAFLIPVVFATAQAAAQPTYSTGFENFALGDVYNQHGWGHPPNSPTEGVVVAAPAPVIDTRSLQIQTRSIANFGGTNHLSSQKIDPAGEDGSSVHTVGVLPDPPSHFSASFWYRTPDAPFISVDQNGTPRTAPGIFAQLNPASKRANFDSEADRYAQIRLSNSTNTLAGLVRVSIGWPTPGGTGFIIQDVADLQWGQWYRFEARIHFIQGLGAGNEPNDLFSVHVFDDAGNHLGQACGSTWEYGYRIGNYLGTGQPLAVNSMDFASNTGPDDRVVGYLDDFTISSGNLGTSLGTVSIAGEATVCETSVLSVVSQNNAEIMTYEWRDAGNNLVGTDPTYTAGPGTYTVTVTDAFCGSATSQPFNVSTYPASSVTISGSLVASPPGPGGTTTLTANPSGGTGTINSYTWTDGSNAVVRTGSSVIVGPGTYRVTVTDDCGTAISNSVIVTEGVVEPIPTASTWALIALGMAIAAVAVTRLR